MADYRGVFNGNDQLQLVLGAGSDQSDDGSSEVDIVSAYGLVQLRPADALNLTLAARRDEHDLFGTHDTYRATAALGSSDAVVRASYGTGFRAPTLSELYGYGGDDSLSPESSRSAELGADLQLGNSLAVGLTGYYIVIEDKIEWNLGLNRNVQLDGRSRVRGAEFEVNFSPADDWSAGFDASYTDSKKPDGSREVRVPRVQYGASADFDVNDRIAIGVTARQVKDVEDVGGVELKDYTLFNLRGVYQISENLKANIRLENATDEDYETVSGYGTAGRAFYVGVSSSF